MKSEIEVSERDISVRFIDVEAKCCIFGPRVIRPGEVVRVRSSERATYEICAGRCDHGSRPILMVTFLIIPLNPWLVDTLGL